MFKTNLKQNAAWFLFAGLILVAMALLAVIILTLFLQPPKCSLMNCHGADFECGPNPPEMCTAMYELGDACRQYASCEVVDGNCRLAANPLLDKCISCTNYCNLQHWTNPDKAFACQENCLNK